MENEQEPVFSPSTETGLAEGGMLGQELVREMVARRERGDGIKRIARELGVDRKTPLVAADLLNDRVIPFLDEHGVTLQRVLTDRGTEYCGAPEHHEYELYLAVENIDHTRTKVKSPQTNGIVERFHRTVLNEFYRVAFRRKIYATTEELQRDLDLWLREYNEVRPHQGRWCYGKTPLQTFIDGAPLAREKMLDSAQEGLA